MKTSKEDPEPISAMSWKAAWGRSQWAHGTFDTKNSSSLLRTWRHNVDLGDGKENQMIGSCHE